jgi:hypothetical protein
LGGLRTCLEAMEQRKIGDLWRKIEAGLQSLVRTGSWEKLGTAEDWIHLTHGQMWRFIHLWLLFKSRESIHHLSYYKLRPSPAIYIHTYIHTISFSKRTLLLPVM